MICIQIPENPEMLNKFVFSQIRVTASAKIEVNQSPADTSPNVPTSISAVGSTWKTSQVVHQCAGPIRCVRETTDEDRREQRHQRIPPSKDVVELKQVALWYGVRQSIREANDASVEGIMTLLRRHRSRFKPRELQTMSQTSRFATEQLSLSAHVCLSSPSHTAQVEQCEESDSDHSSD